MSRIEFRIGYQIWKGDQPKGRIWWHICHTQKQAEKFMEHLRSESRRRKRTYAIADIQVRDVGRWRTARSDEGKLPDWAL